MKVVFSKPSSFTFKTQDGECIGCSFSWALFLFRILFQFFKLSFTSLVEVICKRNAKAPDKTFDCFPKRFPSQSSGEAQGRPRTRLRNYICWLAWEHLSSEENGQG